jgi:hypothetical protein
LEDGFRVAKLSSRASDLHTGDQKAGEAVNALIGLIKEGRQTGGRRSGHRMVERHDGGAQRCGGSRQRHWCDVALGATLQCGTELMQFVDWVSNRVRSWSTVRKQMPTMADLFTAACDEYNWKWKTSITPMLLLRWVAMDWGAIFENDLVALLNHGRGKWRRRGGRR